MDKIKYFSGIMLVVISFLLARLVYQFDALVKEVSDLKVAYVGTQRDTQNIRDMVDKHEIRLVKIESDLYKIPAFFRQSK